MEADDNCVTMMTIHSAKGLEFPVVYVVGMEEGVFPGNSAQYDQEELEEERRLCYVAMTRAREKLTPTNARQRMLYGRTTANRPSRFLEEIPEENMHWQSKPQPRSAAMDRDGFGTPPWEDGASGGFGSGMSGGYGSSGGYGAGRTQGAGLVASGGPRGNSSIRSYRGTAPAPQKPLASARSGGSAAPLLQLQKGDMVEHTAFGKGMVLSVRTMGGDALAEVAFDQVGAKKLMLKSAGAHMKKL